MLAERWVPGRVAASPSRAGTRCPAELAPRALPPPCLPVVHTPFGLLSLWAGVVEGASEQALPAPLCPGFGSEGQQDRGARVLSTASSSFLLSPAPINPLAFKASGYSQG